MWRAEERNRNSFNQIISHELIRISFTVWMIFVRQFSTNMEAERIDSSTHIHTHSYVWSRVAEWYMHKRVVRVCVRAICDCLWFRIYSSVFYLYLCVYYCVPLFLLLLLPLPLVLLASCSSISVEACMCAHRHTSSAHMWKWSRAIWENLCINWMALVLGNPSSPTSFSPAHNSIIYFVIMACDNNTTHCMCR